jgi:PPOX class probable F420-dependent enzyme
MMGPVSRMKSLDSELGSYISLRTFKKDGTGVDTPVWFAENSGKLYVFTEAKSYKVKRLRRNARVQFASCGMFGSVTGTWHEGRARVVTGSKLVARAYRALHAKYGWQMWLTDQLSRWAGRIDKRSILEITPERHAASDAHRSAAIS